jgi:hypothetical protein
VVGVVAEFPLPMIGITFFSEYSRFLLWSVVLCGDRPVRIAGPQMSGFNSGLRARLLPSNLHPKPVGA